jgi:exonuclease III
MKHVKNFIFAHLNVNSVRYKLVEISELLQGNSIDCLFLCETKLDDTCPVAQFNVAGFTCKRKDKSCNKGGMMYYIRNDLAHRRRSDLENMISEHIEALIIEVILRKQEWLFIELYKPPNVHQRVLIDSGKVLQNTQGDVHWAFILDDINVNTCILNVPF